MLAVAYLYDTPNSWFRALPHIIAGNFTHGNTVKALAQSEMPIVKWHHDHNHDYDSVPLQLVRLANLTMNFEWLIVADGDTCFKVDRLKKTLRRLNASLPYIIGHPMSPTWKCCCTNMNCCPMHENPCKPSQYRKNFYSNGFSRPRIWQFGGAGYIISKSLLNSIDTNDWKKCEMKMLRNGGDVRVASCVFSLTGIGITYLPSLLGYISYHKKYVC